MAVAGHRAFNVDEEAYQRGEHDDSRRWSQYGRRWRNTQRKSSRNPDANTFCRSVSRVDTKNNTADLFTKHLDGLRARALAKKFGLGFMDMAGGTNEGTADGGTNEKDR